MPRSVKPWSSENHDADVPPRVQLRIWRRQCGDANFAICPLTGLPLQWTDEKHLHHIKALILDGAHSEDNLVYVHAAANREQAKAESAEKAGNDARAKKHLGIKTKPTQLTGRDRKQRDADKDARSRAVGAKPRLAPRQIYRSTI